MAGIEEVFTDLAGRTDAVPLDSAVLSRLSDDDVLGLQRSVAGLRAAADRKAAACAAEIARRSARRLGREGLAVKQGHTNTGALLRAVTGVTNQEASALLTAAEMLDATAAAEQNARLVAEHPEVALPPEACERPWYATLADAVRDGVLSVAVSSSIRRGLGEPTPTKATFGHPAPDSPDAVTAEKLAAALPHLVEVCRGVDADRAWRAARDARDELDAAGLAGRSETARAQRFWRVYRKPSGQVGGSFLFDAEDGAILDAIYRQVTHPKTKGVARWVSDDELARRRRIEGDDRTTDQVAADALLTLLRAGASAPGTGIPMGGTGLVRLIATRETAERPETPDDEGQTARRPGFAALDGSGVAVPVQTLDRHLCEGTLDIVFDTDGHPIDVGHEQRLFSRRQKIGLIVRDGGCRWPGCEQPGEYSEAHHIAHWKRDHGPTRIRNGIMLCRRHHLLLHNHGWEITRHGDQYELVPPKTVDVEQRPVPMPARARIRPPTAHQHRLTG